MFSLNRQKIVGVATKERHTMVANPTTMHNVHMGGADYATGVLEGMLDTVNESVLNSLYREIYLYDTVSGPTVDLMANLPWSSFSLTGISDSKVLQHYADSVAEMGIVNLMIQLSVSFLVLGRVVGSLIFNEKRGIFTDIIIHDPDSCEFTPIPLRGYDPKIDLKLNEDLKKFLRSKDPRDREALSEIDPKMMAKLLKGTKIPLEPLNTLYLSRNSVPGIDSISYYTRILPIWLIEKALMRGTIIGAWRRQRSILHVLAGNEEWDPTEEQLTAINSMFIDADQDPQGAVVTTRQGIDVSEVRQGSDFWKVSDEWDIFANAKMRALGVNESFLSGDATYSSMEVALSVFLENLRNFREFMTRNILYDKIFLMIAKYHGYKKRTNAEISHKVRLSSNSDKSKGIIENTDGSLSVSIKGAKNLSEYAKYELPVVSWHKELTARADMNFIDVLGQAQEKGIPIPLAMLATACGVDISEVLDSLEEDINNRKKVKAYKDKLAEEGLEGGGGEEGGGGGFYGKATDDNVVIMPSKIAKEMILTPKQARSILEKVGKVKNSDKLTG